MGVQPKPERKAEEAPAGDEVNLCEFCLTDTQTGPLPPLEEAVTRVLTIQTPDGGTIELGEGWVINGEQAKAGDEITLNPEVGNANDWEGFEAFGLKPGGQYKVIERK